MAIKGVSVDLEESLHARVAGAAKVRGQKIPQAYAEALERWLAWVNGEDKLDTLIGELSGREATLLRGVLAYIRDKPYTPEREAWVQALAMLAKRYGK